MYAITDPQNGWDCLVAIVTDCTDELEALCEKNGWMILSSYRGAMTAAQFVKDYDYD